MANHQQSGFDAHANGPRYAIPDDLKSLFFPSWSLKPTLEGALFRRLHDAVEMELQPQDLFDAMDVAEITHLFFEQQQVQASLRDIKRAARTDSLNALLTPLVGHDLLKAAELTGDYFSGDKEKRAKVIKMLHDHGLEENSIDAMAMGQRAYMLPPLTRMASTLGIRRDQLVEAARERKAARTPNTTH